MLVVRLDTKFAEGVRALVTGKHDFLHPVVLHLAVGLVGRALSLVLGMLSVRRPSLCLERHWVIVTRIVATLRWLRARPCLRSMLASIELHRFIH